MDSNAGSQFSSKNISLKKFPYYYIAFRKNAYLHWWRSPPRVRSRYGNNNTAPIQNDFTLTQAIAGRRADYIAPPSHWNCLFLIKAYLQDFYRNTITYSLGKYEDQSKSIDLYDPYSDLLLLNLSLANFAPHWLKGIISVKITKHDFYRPSVDFQQRQEFSAYPIFLLRAELANNLLLLAKYGGYALRLMPHKIYEIFKEENRPIAQREVMDLLPIVGAEQISSEDLTALSLVEFPANILTHDYQLVSRQHELDYFAHQGIIPLDVLAQCLFGFLDYQSFALLLFAIITTSILYHVTYAVSWRDLKISPLVLSLHIVISFVTKVWAVVGFLLGKLIPSNKQLTPSGGAARRSLARNFSVKFLYVTLLLACFHYNQFFGRDLLSFMLRYHTLNIDSLSDFLTHRQKFNLTLNILNDSRILDFVESEISSTLDSTAWLRILNDGKSFLYNYNEPSQVKLAHPLMCELLIACDPDWAARRYHCSPVTHSPVRRYTAIFKKLSLKISAERNHKILAPFLRSVTETHLTQHILLAARIQAYLATYYPTQLSQNLHSNFLDSDNNAGGLFTADSMYRLLVDLSIIFLTSFVIYCVEYLTNSVNSSRVLRNNRIRP